MTKVHTRTHVHIRFANPYLKCLQCGGWVTGWHTPEICECDTYTVNVPCCCRAAVSSVCPSWSPVDDCSCMTGTHEEPPGQVSGGLQSSDPTG